MTEAAPYFHLTVGQFNLAGNDKEWRLSISYKGKHLSELFDEDSEPDIEGLRPSKVVELISERLESYWINTGRPKAREQVAWFRQHANEMDLAWARAEIKRAETKITALHAHIAEMEELSEQLSGATVEAAT